MDLILRTFYIDEEIALRLSNRASYQKSSPDELVRAYVEKYVSANTWSVSSDKNDEMTLRSFYITREQDYLLDILSDKLQTTKGSVFRAAIAAGLDVSNRGIK